LKRLKTHDLACGYGARAIVENCDLALERGSATVIVGPNGAGKSTILKTLAAALPPLSGRVEVDGVDLHQLGMTSRARQVAMLIQIQPLDPALTVEELVELGRTPYLGAWGHLRQVDRQVVDDALSICRLAELRNRQLGHISGGERQRARLAMVLAQQTPIVLLDEPTNHLDVSHRFMLFEILSQIREERGATVVVVAHSLADATRFGDEILYVSQGRARSFETGDFEQLKAVIEESADVPADWVY
jgi:iron complex transport system ATP-binding protein